MSIKNFNRYNQQKRTDIFKQRRNLNKNMENTTKSERLMNGIGVWTSWYRLFPHKFIEDYIGVKLKLFQQILIYFMMHFNFFMYIASRGQGKTFLTSLFCCARAILFPESKIIISAGNLKQGIEVVEKIDDMRNNCPNLAREIEDLRTNTQNAGISFKNGSWIKVVASNQGSRSKRANVIVVDEFRMVDKAIIDGVLRKFMTAPRQPKYLEKPEYKHMQERNKELYLSSAWMKSHWSWDKVNAFFNSMTDGKSYFVCSLPYQIAIKEGLLMREQVEDEMSESDFSEISWLMEMEAMFFGESEKAFFKFADLEKNRVLPKPIYPKSFYSILRNKNFKFTEKETAEIRIITCDISGMSSAKNNNDASVFTIIRLIPNKTKTAYDKYVCYMESLEGGHSQIQALQIRRLYEEFDCDYIVIDTQSFGLSIFDNLATNLYDKELDREYEALNCINDEEMAKRCFVDNAPKVIYSIKADARLNSDMHVYVRDEFKRGRLRLLVNENESKEILTEIKGYKDLPIEEQITFQMPFIQTTFLINEMINLERVDTGNDLIKLKEPSTKRKDRYSSLGYGVYIAKQLEFQLRPKKSNKDVSQLLKFRTPNIYGK
ncbi:MULTISPECIES: terminase family protein [unclassified Clostridium]|uniref:terminase large subunit domain-containing protein n=1 Tax=unclassified Clostridium TaxID=2614128 RepID=UPI0020797FB0|nr:MULTISPECIES: terminase family protein [unclassified Clostridium]